MPDVPDGAMRLWRSVTGSDAPDGVLSPGSRHVVRTAVGLCPPGWTGVLRLGDALLVQPGEADDEALTQLLALGDPSDPEQTAPLHAGSVLGPAELAYLPDGVSPPAGEVPPGMSVSADELAAWLAALPADDVEESGADELVDPFVLRRDGEIAGVAGWADWPQDVAHLGVFVAPRFRGRGVGTGVARAALQHALDAGRTPQWRARTTNAASRAIARRLGLVEVGRQLSIERLRAR